MDAQDKAFTILMSQHRSMLMAYVRSLVRDTGLAEDLVQEAFLAAYKSLETFHPDGNFGAWLRGIARNKVRMSQRAQARHSLVIDSRIVEGMEDVYTMFETPTSRDTDWDDRLAVIHSCIARLAGRLREAIRLYYTEGLSLQEAALRLNASIDAVGQRLFRARVEIRKCVALKLAARTS